MIKVTNFSSISCLRSDSIEVVVVIVNYKWPKITKNSYSKTLHFLEWILIVKSPELYTYILIMKVIATMYLMQIVSGFTGIVTRYTLTIINEDNKDLTTQ